MKVVGNHNHAELGFTTTDPVKDSIDKLEKQADCIESQIYEDEQLLELMSNTIEIFETKLKRQTVVTAIALISGIAGVVLALI